MADPKPICSGTADTESRAAEATAAAEEVAHQSLPLPKDTPSEGENNASIYISATPIAPQPDQASGIQRSAQLFRSESAQLPNATEMKKVVASLGFDPALLLGDWGAANTANFNPDGVKLLASSADARNVTKFVDADTLFSVSLTYNYTAQDARRGGSNLLQAVTINYEGYESEIPVQVVQLQNGSRLHVLGGRFKGVFLYQYGTKLFDMKIVSATELLNGIAQDLHLTPLTNRGSRSDREAKAAAETQRKENRLPTVFSEDGILPSRENKKTAETRAAVVDFLSKAPSLVSTLEPLLASADLRPGIARLLLKIHASEDHQIPEGLSNLSEMVAAGNIQEAIDALEEIISSKTKREAKTTPPPRAERPPRPDRPARPTGPPRTPKPEEPPVVVKNPIPLDQIIPQTPKPADLPIQETDYLPIALNVSDEKSEMREIRLASARAESFRTYEDEIVWLIKETYMIRNPEDGSVIEFEIKIPVERGRSELYLGLKTLWYQNGQRDSAEAMSTVLDRFSGNILLKRNEKELQVPIELLNSLATQGNTGDHSLTMTLTYEAKKADQIAKFIAEGRMIPQKTTNFIITKAISATGDPVPIASIKLAWASFTPIEEGQSLNTVEVSETYQVELLTGYRFTFTVIREVTLSLDRPGGEIRTTSKYKLPTESNANFSTENARTMFPTPTDPVELSLDEGTNHFQLRFKLSPSDSEKTLSIPISSLEKIATTGALSFPTDQPIIFESPSPNALEVNQCIGEKGVFTLEDPYGTKPFVNPIPITYNLRTPDGSAGLHRTVATLLGIDPTDLRGQGNLLSQINHEDSEGRIVLNPQAPYRSFKLGNLTLNGTYEALLPSTLLPTLLGADVTYRGIPIETVAIYNVQTTAASGVTPIRQYVLVQSPSGQKLLFYRNLMPGIDVDPQLQVISSEDKVTTFDEEMAKQYRQIQHLKSDVKKELKQLQSRVDRDIILNGIEETARGSKDKFLQSRLNTLFMIFKEESELYREAALLFAQDYVVSESDSHPLLNIDRFLKDRLPAELQRRSIIEKRIAESLRERFSEDKKWEEKAIEKFLELGKGK